ncbi:MAG: helix-turn-helix domain-containing protein [Prevotellaceae bacterium]|jgi:transcriptional regulator with XRE-family HTH domain|nr:helix-turn-helix domain-containing protein [Prevotellaceae bacterium]
MTERLTQFLTAEQLSPTRFADLIGVQPSGVSHILSGRNKPGYDFMEKFIKRFPAVNIEWFITGKGKMYKERVMPDLFNIPIATPPVEAPTPILNTEEKPVEAPIPLPPYPTEAATQLSGRIMEKDVEKVIIFYTDNTFSAYSPNKRKE